MSAPASAKSAMKSSGFSTIMWQSRGSLVMGRSALTMGGPKVMLGTKWPSMTSTWTMVPPPRSAAATSSARWAKSEARMENASSITWGLLLRVSLSAVFAGACDDACRDRDDGVVSDYDAVELQLHPSFANKAAGVFVVFEVANHVTTVGKDRPAIDLNVAGVYRSLGKTTMVRSTSGRPSWRMRVFNSLPAIFAASRLVSAMGLGSPMTERAAPRRILRMGHEPSSFAKKISPMRCFSGR